MVSINPHKLTGAWNEGFVLDIHTLSSSLIGYDEFGHEMFDTKRSALGELLYKLKYGTDKSVLNDILDTVVEFLLNRWKVVQSLDLIVPMPPSNTSRRSQPVIELARGLGSRTGVPVLEDALAKVKETPQLKNVYDYQERARLLSEAFEARGSLVQGKTVLLLDDLYRSGATLNAASQALRQRGKAKTIYVLALTRTRSNT
jgi:predicted amidophosphoribosyltransferase